MYPEILPQIREVIKRRYELIPYIYALHHEGRLNSDPPVSWLGWGKFMQDPKTLTAEILDGADFWLGTGRLLVAGVFEAGKSSRSVYLPKASSTDTEVYYELFPPFATVPAGESTTVKTPLDNIAVFARSGSVLPIGKPCVTISSDVTRTTNDGTQLDLSPGRIELDDWRGIEIFPPKASRARYSSEWVEDDGESLWPCPIAEIDVQYWSEEDDTVSVKANWKQREFTPLWNTLWVALPMGDERRVRDAIGRRNHRDGRLLQEISIV